MIKNFELGNYGPIRSIKAENCGPINLIIGPNRSGKTLLLKALYTAQRTIELFKRGKNIDSDKDILFKKLYWTFQIDKIGNLVSKPDKGNLYFSMTDSEGGTFSYSFSPSTEKQIVKLSNTCSPSNSNSIFLPAKEVLSLLEIIEFEREDRQAFGFDETYYDLAKALTPGGKGKNKKIFSKMRNELEEAIDGRIVFSKEKDAWVFRQGNMEIDINLTSEGTKKIAILDTLLGNHFLSEKSIVFIDEPEAGLHPSLLVRLLDIITALAKAGLQFFIASHSYFVIKKLYLIAHQNQMDIPVISFQNDSELSVEIDNLKEGMPKNQIIDESIELYTQELCL